MWASMFCLIHGLQGSKVNKNSNSVTEMMETEMMECIDGLMMVY